tara:strand:- start:10 stop:456 length:447 start_codon:yes stop_codon:yes gene_type:complete
LIGLVQKVSKASVLINGQTKRTINRGLVVLLGITSTDTSTEVDYVANKVLTLRLFESNTNNFDFSIQDIQGDLLLVSQFTLPASVKKGRRPDFTNAAKPEIAEPLYQSFVDKCKSTITHVETGEFGADMQVQIVNDGPVTLIIDSCTA